MNKEFNLKSIPLETFEKTVLKVFEFTEKYFTDVIFLESQTPEEVFNFVKNLEYKPDPKNIEFISRPKFSIFENNLPRDCDDKTLIITSYAKLKNIPFKIAVIGKENQPHHIFPILKLNKEWVYFDATYESGKIGELIFKPKFFRIYEFFN